MDNEMSAFLAGQNSERNNGYCNDGMGWGGGWFIWIILIFAIFMGNGFGQSVAAQASGDNVLRREAQTNINALTEYYKKISEKSGLATDFSRTRVEGFKEMGKRELQKAAGSGTITVAGQTVNARIRSQKQQEHIFGSKAFEKRVERAKTNGGNVQSAFYAGTNVEKLISSQLGKGDPVVNRDGSISEYMSFDTDIGQVWLLASQKYIPTSRVCVKYAKDGWHAYPVFDKEK